MDGETSTEDRAEHLFEGRSELVRALGLVRAKAARTFPGGAYEAWLRAGRELADAASPAVASSYLRHSPDCAALLGPLSALALARAMAPLAALAGGEAAAALARAAPKAARRLDASAFAEWLGVMRHVAALAPESLASMLGPIETLLAETDPRGLEAWAIEGIRAASGDPVRRRAFLSLRDPAAAAALARAGSDTTLSTLERRLRAYVIALWGAAPVIRKAEATSPDRPGRASFDRGLVSMPESFRGYSGEAGKAVFQAASAHIAAHLAFGGGKFPLGSLKPVQVALVSIVEDARVESLAMEAFPGLRRLWGPFHIADTAGAVTSPALMGRLSRALFEPSYDDPHDWVRKGREMFAAESANRCDPTASRRIGMLLGNDLGQMRLQFNARTYAPEPVYRDDNLGLWDFGDASPGVEAESIVESARFEQREDSDGQPNRKRESRESDPAEAIGRATSAVLEPEAGVPVARYPEWDHLIAQERPDWTTVLEYEPIPGRASVIDGLLERDGTLVRRVDALVRAAKVSRPSWRKRQAEGEQLDLDAAVSAVIDRRLGLTPDSRVYRRQERRTRDLSVLLLLDVSQSTNDIVPRVIRPVLEIEREAAALLAHAMARIGDQFAIRAFCSDRRSDVRYYRIKDFERTYDDGAKRLLAGLTGRFSTRIGAALRHAGSEHAGRRSYRRLLLVITDGEPSDLDVADRKYLVEDARRAVHGLAHAGIDVFCVGLDAGGDKYLTRIFDRRNVLRIDRIEKLPERLSMLYLRLTA
jgi:nitric oxide reductase NorD protein